MATAPAANPFQQFISGLFGNLSGTSPKPASSTPYAGPYAAGKAPTSTPAKASSFNWATDPRVGANASYVNPTDAANSRAAAAGIPYIPGDPKTGRGGMSVAPNMTSAATGKPASSRPGVVNPKADPGYVNPLNATPGPGASNYRAPSSPSSGGSSAFSAPTAFAAAAPAAPAAAPVGSGSSGFSYASPSGSSFGGGAQQSNDYRKAYTDMLAGLYSTDDLTEATDALDKLKKQTADAQLFSREEERRIRENEQGQGYKTFAGDLRENTRKSAAELADLAIASNPLQEYITNAMNASKELYGVERDADNTMYSRGRDVVQDQRNAAQDALTERKFQEDVRQFGLRYALDAAQEARLGRESTKADKIDYVSQFAQAFTPGQRMADGTPTTDTNGFITPKAFKEAAAEAAQYGITRKEFIEMFGAQLYTDKDGLPDKSYGLTNVEKKLIAGTVE